MPDVTIAGGSYTDVPAISVPAAGGGTASFYDVSSTTATASDVLHSKVFVAADGTITIGTGDDGMVIASYGHTTYADVLAAYQANKIVYCRASSGSNPASGSQTRMAFLAYVNSQDTPTEIEFQYYRSVNAHSDAQQGDQVYVYKLSSQTGWSVTTREAYTKVVAGSGLSSSYNNGTITLSLDVPSASGVSFG